MELKAPDKTHNPKKMIDWLRNRDIINTKNLAK